MQIHDGSYPREDCSKPFDDHGPLTLQEILLAGRPTVGVRTGASFVWHGETGIVGDRIPPGASCVKRDADAAALAAFIESLEKAQTFNRQSLRQGAADQFRSDRILVQVASSICIASNLGFAALKKSATRPPPTATAKKSKRKKGKRVIFSPAFLTNTNRSQ